MKHELHNNEPKVLVATQAQMQPVPVVLPVLIVSLVVLLLNIGALSGT